MKLRLVKMLYFLLIFSFLPLCASGQITIENPLKYDTFDKLIDAFINFIFWVGMALAPIMVLIAGFNLMTAAGDPKKVDTAKKILLYTAVGLAIILMAKGLIGILNQVLGVKPPPT
jgi:magnesium-transporting ATPase (P-type)